MLVGLSALAYAAARTYRRARRLRVAAAELQGWLTGQALQLEGEQKDLSALSLELASRLQVLGRRLRPARRLLGSAVVLEAIRWSVRRLRGKPFRRRKP